MAKFKYPMDNLLNIKEKIEEQKRMELGQAMVSFQKEQAYMESCRQTHRKALEAFAVAQQRSMIVSEFQRLTTNINYYENQIREQQMMVEKARKVVEQKRFELRKALEEKQIQEKLKEKAFEVFVEEEKLNEQKILDEIVSYRYSKNEEE